MAFRRLRPHPVCLPRLVGAFYFTLPNRNPKLCTARSINISFAVRSMAGLAWFMGIWGSASAETPLMGILPPPVLVMTVRPISVATFFFLDFFMASSLPSSFLRTFLPFCVTNPSTFAFRNGGCPPWCGR